MPEIIIKILNGWRSDIELEILLKRELREAKTIRVKTVIAKQVTRATDITTVTLMNIDPQRETDPSELARVFQAIGSDGATKILAISLGVIF